MVLRATVARAPPSEMISTIEKQFVYLMQNLLNSSNAQLGLGTNVISSIQRSSIIVKMKGFT